jgi:heme A synthase
MMSARRHLTVQALAWTLVMLMLVVIGVSAWLRLAQPRATCDSWPVCRAVTTSTMTLHASARAEQLRPARAVHRVAASSALLVILVLLAVALARPPRDRDTARAAWALLLLAVALSVLGIASAGSRALPVVFGNLFGGYAMLAVAYSITRTQAVDDARTAQRLARDARLGVLLWAMQIALGATAGAGAPTAAAFVHLCLALVAAGWAMRVARQARAAGLACEARLLKTLALAQWLIGASAAWFGAPTALLVVHDVSAAAGLALMFGMQRRNARAAMA